MFFTRLFDPKLAHASYVVGCQATGDAVVIDPNRDVAQYLAAAASEKLRITHVTETHIHADFVSGARELAQVTGAQLLLSAEGGPDWQYGFARTAHAVPLHDGSVFTVGRLRFDVLHLPGHTPEHVVFLLTDLPASPAPCMVFTGDCVFVGDVGRPDLLERAANVSNTMESSAKDLWQSLARFRTLPDHVQVWPAHGAGSACGKALGAVPSSTVGYEKLVNWGLMAADERTFVRSVLEGQPEPPAYFARMKFTNRDGSALAGGGAAPARLSHAEFSRSLGTHTIVDLRPADAFAEGHAPNAINVPLTRSFTTYAGSAVPLGRPLLLVSADEAGASATAAARDLYLIGFDSVAGFVGPSALAELSPLSMTRRVLPADAIARHAHGVALIDVRNSSERAEIRVAGSQHIAFPQLTARAHEIPRGKPVMVQCQTGSRSAIATSVLSALGFDAIDAGGMVAWQAAGGPVEAQGPA